MDVGEKGRRRQKEDLYEMRYKLEALFLPAISIFLILRPDVGGFYLQFRFKNSKNPILLFLTKPHAAQVTSTQS